MQDIDEWKDDPDEYKYRLELIPWRKQHHSFFSSWAWAQETESGNYSKPIDVIEWAGLDKNDLIEQEPYPA